MAALVLLTVAVGCGDDDEGLPPGDDEGLAEVFQPFFEPLGLEFTYGSVVDFRGGKHLQLYVEPTGPATDEQYLERMLARRPRSSRSPSASTRASTPSTSARNPSPPDPTIPPDPSRARWCC